MLRPTFADIEKAVEILTEYGRRLTQESEAAALALALSATIDARRAREMAGQLLEDKNLHLGAAAIRSIYLNIGFENTSIVRRSGRMLTIRLPEEWSMAMAV